jgi:VWFA-related protein
MEAPLRKVSVVLLLLAALGSSASAFAQPGVPRSTEPAVPGPISRPIVRGWPSVDLNVVVLNRRKQPNGPVDPSGFQITQDGVQEPISLVSTTENPVSLCFLIDNSGSTNHVRQPIRDTVIRVFKGLPPGSEAAAILFSDRAFLDLPFAPVANGDLEFLSHLEARGGTALFDALIVATDYCAAHAREKRRALVLISDGGENASKSSYEQVERRLLSPGAPTLYALIFPDDRGSPVNFDRQIQKTKKLTKTCGGLVLEARKTEDLATLTDPLLADLGSQYALTFNSTDQARDGRLRKLDVRLPEPGFEIHAQSGYYAPAQ